VKTVTGTPDPTVVQRQNQLSDLYTRFAVQYQDEPDYDPDDDPDFVRQARQIMGLPPLAAAAQTAAVAVRTLTAFAVAEFAGSAGRPCVLTVSHEFCRGADGLPIHPGPCRGVKNAVKTVASDVARAPAAPRARKAAAPKPVKAVSKVPASALTEQEKQRATKLIKKDPMIFPSARERLGRVSTSGLLSNEDAAWLEDLFQREPAYANHVAQQARVDNLLARQAKAEGKTPAAYKREQAARLKQAVDGKPIAVRVADESALQGILRDGRMRTSHEKSIKRAPTLGTDLRARRLAEAVNGTPEDTPADKRPIYGYVAVNGVEPALEPGRKTPGIAERQGQEDVLSVYGKIQVVLRPKVRDRTTVTVGDSLDELPYVRPSPIDNPSADSIGLHDLDSPDFTRTGYIEAQVHDGVSVDDIAAVVFPSQPSPATIEQLKAHGIPWRVLGRGDKPLSADQFDTPAKGTVPSARPSRARVSANIPDADPVVRARQRQADIDHVRARADLVSEAAKLIDYEATPETLAHKLRADAERRGITDAPEVKALLAAADSHDTAKLQKAMRQLTKKLNVQQRGEPGQIVPFDGREMRHIGGAPARGTFVHVIRPGFLYTPKGDTEAIPVIKTDVEQATPEEIATHRGQTAALSEADRLEFDRLHPRGFGGKFGHSSGLTGVEALESVPARLTPGKRAHHGHYEGEKLHAPAGAGKVRALSQYEGVEYQRVNEFLRGTYRSQPGPGVVPEDDGSEHSLHKLLTGVYGGEPGDLSVVDIAEEIDKTMAVSRLPEDIVVERTVRHGAQVFGRDVWYGDVVDWNTPDFDELDRQIEEHWDKGERPDLTGLVFRDLGYSSTTVDPEITRAYAERFARVNSPQDGEPIVFRILAPKGTGAVALSPKEKGSEAEILLERGLTFEVVHDHGVDADGVRRIDLRVVPNEQ
jgi:hypothetical protein